MKAKPRVIVVPVVIQDGTLVFALEPRAHRRLRAQFAAAIKGWPNGPAELTLEPFEDTRRARANRYLFGPVYSLILEAMAGRVTPALKRDLHEAMKRRHNPQTATDPVTGEEFIYGGSTRTLTVEAFSNFLEAVMLDGAEAFGVVFPEPRATEEWRQGEPA